MESSSSPPLSAVVFDLDGLMLNTEDLYQYVGSQVLDRRGKSFTDELLDQIMGRPGAIALQMMIDHHGLDDTVDGLAAESAVIFEEILDERLATMPGLLDLLDALEAAEIPKAVATSSGRAFVTRVLGPFQLEPRFQFVLTSEDVERGKPDPEIYQKAAAKFQITPQQMLVLEDSENGCRAAAASGAFAVAVPGGHSHRHDFSQASLIANSLADARIYAALGIQRA